MLGGKALLVDLIKLERAPSRAAEDQTGAPGPRLVTASRWRTLAGSLEGQDSMACSKVSGASLHLGQVVGSWLSHHRWAQR